MTRQYRDRTKHQNGASITSGSLSLTVGTLLQGQGLSGASFPYTVAVYAQDTSGNVTSYEEMDVTGGSYPTVTVTRGINGTTAVAHDTTHIIAQVVGINDLNNFAQVGALSTADVSNPPIESELEAALGSPVTVGRQLAQINDANLERNEYASLSDGTAYWSALLAKARLASTTATSTNAASPQTTPTYDGSGQVVEPCVLHFADGWPATGTSYKYWMAIIPFPAGADAFQNPSMLVSNDGTTWSVPAGLTNPIVAAPGGTANNDDPWILVDSAGTMWYYYVVQDPTVGFTKIYVMSSTNGVTWSAPSLLITTGNANNALSPSVVYDGTQYVMWTNDITTTPYTLNRRTCATPNGTWSAPAACTVTGLPSGYDLAHSSVYKRGVRWHCFGMLWTIGGHASAHLYLLESTDGLTWTCAASALIAPSVSGWDNSTVGRGGAVPTATGYDLWYSGNNTSGVWRLGRTNVSLNNLTLEQIGRLIQIRDTKAMIESFGGTLEETAIAYATDTNRLGIYSGGRWNWSASLTDTTLPIASTTALGAVKIGTNVSEAIDGTISAGAYGPLCTGDSPPALLGTSDGQPIMTQIL